MTKKKNIAIVGSGISGLTCGYLLSKAHNITLFEANDYIGGHTATVDVTVDNKPLAVDTGFIVFNDRTYPNFIKLMDRIKVNRKPTEMSFSVTNRKTGLEYNGHDLNTLFAQRINLFRPKFYKFIFEILRFNKEAKKLIDKMEQEGRSVSETDTLGGFLKMNRFSKEFSDQYILPMVSAIWSSSQAGSLQFPLHFFLQFFSNHGLLDIKDRPQWYVISNGSRSYIPKLLEPIQAVLKNHPVVSVKREANEVIVESKNKIYRFDEIIFACHSDQALRLLSDATVDEKKVLGAIKYQENEVVLHTDISVLPREKRAYASWNYWLDAHQSSLPSVTYNMNILQGLESKETICVTLNQSDAICEDKILGKYQYAHPVFNSQSIIAQQLRGDITNRDRTHFCGAYWYNGFHEDGVRSALDVCTAFGVEL